MPTRKNIFYPQDDFVSVIDAWKTHGDKIVFTNGCFDILHAGHIQYLQEAKELGDKLVIGLNSDYSVKLLKGETRPINNQDDRAFVLSALEAVDMIIIFEEETPLSLIRKVLPDCLAKGGDYQIENIVGAKLMLEEGKEVKVLSLREGYSSSNIIAQMS